MLGSDIGGKEEGNMKECVVSFDELGMSKNNLWISLDRPRTTDSFALTGDTGHRCAGIFL